jgi:dTDP-4-dehydrorhamnose 3,5-epimerase
MLGLAQGRFQVRIEPTGITGIAILHWEFALDRRGGFARTFCQAELAAAGLPFEVVQANVSRNTARHTLRGMHFQRAPHGEPKIVSCTRGRIWEVAVDMRPDSPTCRQWRAFELAPDRGYAIHLPSGIAHGFMTLEPDSEVHYLMGAGFVPEAATGLRWNDPAIAISWPAAPAVISDRDAGFALLDAAPGETARPALGGGES